MNRVFRFGISKHIIQLFNPIMVQCVNVSGGYRFFWSCNRSESVIEKSNRCDVLPHTYQ